MSLSDEDKEYLEFVARSQQDKKGNVLNTEKLKTFRILWVRVKGTINPELGMAIDVDPSKPLEENIKMAITVAQNELNTKGWLATCTNISWIDDELIVGEVYLSQQIAK